MDWVSFDEIKKTVSLEMVIRRYGIQLRRAGTNTLRGKCPLPTHSSKESKESFTATLDKGVGGVWACQSQSCIKARGSVGGNVLDFVAAMEKCSVRDAAVTLQTWFLGPAAGNESGPVSKDPWKPSTGTKPPMDSRKEKTGGGESKCNTPLAFQLQHIDHAHPYLEERGVTIEVAEKFGIGFFPGKGSMHNRIVIPIHNVKGELVAYAGRSIDGSEPRYTFPAGFHKSRELYNLHRVSNEVSAIIVEGFFDCIRVMQTGYPCVALMGSTMSAEQEELIRQHFGQVVVMLDGDDAGREAGEQIVEKLRRAIFQVDLMVLPNGRQPDELSADELGGMMEVVQIVEK